MKTIRGRSKAPPNSFTISPPPRARLRPDRPPPQAWRHVIGSVLISPVALRRRIKALAAQLNREYSGRTLTIVALLNGTIPFAADLLRDLTVPVELDSLGISSYRRNRKPRKPLVTKEIQIGLAGKDVLLLDDVLDSGATLDLALKRIRGRRPRSLRLGVLLEKQVPRVHAVRADYIGFRIPDLFVVGYGLDYADQFRQLPFIGTLREPS